MSNKNRILTGTCNKDKVMTGTINNNITHRWNLNVNKRSVLGVNFSINMNNNMLKTMNGILIIFLVKKKQNTEKIINFELNKNNVTYTNKINLDVSNYYFEVSYSGSTKVNYKFNIITSDIVIPVAPTIQIQPVQPPLPPPISVVANISKKYALIVTITDYLFISDLSYCDEDAVAWCNFLSKNNYEIYLLGDKTSTYGNFKINDYATEDNVKKYMNLISAKVIKDDQFVFISSGHGSGDGKGNSFICCLDCTNNPNGQYTDKELALNIKSFTNKKAKVILFFDNCFSGGLIPEVIGNDTKLVCATSTCTENGYGFDVSQYKQGAWTYHFLIKTLLINPIGSINETFTKALINYPFKQTGNLPQLGGNGSLKF